MRRARTWWRVSPLPDRHEAVEGAERGRGRQQLHAGLAGPRRRAHARARARPRRAAGRPAPAPRRRAPRRRPVPAAAIAALRPAAPPPTTSTSAWRRRYSVRHSRSCWSLRTRPSPAARAQHLLVEGPQAPRADEGLVVEAGRREGAAEQVGGAHRVELERWRRVHVLDPHALAQRLRAGAHARGAVHLHEAVGALAGAAHEPAAAVVLEAAREGAPAGREQRRADRVARRGRRTSLPSKVKRQLALPVDPLPVARRAACSPRALRQLRQEHLVRAGVALGQEPGAAPRAVEPPLALHAGHVVAEVVVGAQLALPRGPSAAAG